MDEFEWDNAKAAANLQKHGIDFEDVIAMFEGAVLEVKSDRDGEERWKSIGIVDGVVLAVVYTVRAARRRIISARRANRSERQAYYQAHAGEQAEG